MEVSRVIMSSNVELNESLSFTKCNQRIASLALGFVA
jgi:hypothetical protein